MSGAHYIVSSMKLAYVLETEINGFSFSIDNRNIERRS